MRENEKKKEYFVAIAMRDKMSSGFSAIYRLPKYIFCQYEKNNDYIQL